MCCNITSKGITLLYKQDIKVVLIHVEDFCEIVIKVHSTAPDVPDSVFKLINV